MRRDRVVLRAERRRGRARARRCRGTPRPSWSRSAPRRRAAFHLAPSSLGLRGTLPQVSGVGARWAAVVAGSGARRRVARCACARPRPRLAAGRPAASERPARPAGGAPPEALAGAAGLSHDRGLHRSSPCFRYSAKRRRSAALRQKTVHWEHFVSRLTPSTHAEALPAQPVDVVRQADEEEHEHEQEPDHARALHDREGDRPAADLLGQRPEDVAAVERAGTGTGSRWPARAR